MKLWWVKWLGHESDGYGTAMFEKLVYCETAERAVELVLQTLENGKGDFGEEEPITEPKAYPFTMPTEECVL